MVKKLITLGIAVLFLFSIVGLTACGDNSHGIPNGKYVPNGSWSEFILFEKGMVNNDYYWKIKGNTATWYASNQKSSTRTIVQKDGKIFFESETITDEVEYDDATKSFKLLPTIILE